MSELKEKGSPRQTELLTELSNQTAQNETIILLLNVLIEAVEANGSELKTVNGYKEEQKQGDIKFRKKTNTSSLISISIAMTALAISVKGVDYFVNLFNGWVL